MCENISCSRCHQDKPISGFWWNKDREKVDQPCKDCRNSQKRLRRAEMKSNNRFSKSELDKSYRLKGFDGDLREALVSKILLERTIKRVTSPHILTVDGALILVCPHCEAEEVAQVPIELEELVNLTNKFLALHGNTCKK